MLGFYNYTVYLTYVGLLSSMAGMFLAVSGHTMGAVICLLFSGVCDMFDGKIARTKKDRTLEEKRFGIQIDSLCDVICFGVFPAMLGVSVGADKIWQLIIAGLFVLCGVIRLAFFNVTEELRQDKTDENRKIYQGVPITTSALMIPMLMCFQQAIGNAFPAVYSILLAVMGFFFICPLSVRKPGKWGGAVMLGLGFCVFIVMVCVTH